MSQERPDPDELRRLEEDVRSKRHQAAKAGARYYSCLGWLVAGPVLLALAVIVLLLLLLLL